MKKNSKKTSKKVKIFNLVGKTDISAARLIIPFNTRYVTMPKKELPTHGKFVFTAHPDKKRNIEYVFSGIDLTCHCEDCNALR